MSYAEDSRLFEERTRLRVTCKHCGHTKAIPSFVDKVICSWCKHYIFRNDEIESKYRFKEKILKEIKNKRRD